MFRNLLERPSFYNFSQKALSIIALGNSGIPNYLKKEAVGKSKIIDVGCGTGRYANLFKKGYLGIDINSDYIQAAKRKNLPGDLNFSVMDATWIELPDESFDCVFCVGLLHHLNDIKTSKVAQEMLRICKKNGRVIIIEPVTVSNPLGRILFSLDRGKYRRSFEELSRLLSKVGISPIRPFLEKSFPYRVSVFGCYKV